MARRAAGEGTVYKMPNGRWRARVRRHGRTAQAVRRTKGAAAAELPRLRRQVGVAMRAPTLTVGEWLADWIETLDRAASTERLYRRMVTDHLTPHLGKVKLGELDPLTVDTAYHAMQRQGVGTATIQRAHSVLSVALRDAVRAGLTDSAATTYAKPPAHKPAKPRPLDPGQARALLAYCRTPTAPSGDIIAIILLLGLRVGEAIDLRWHHVDRTNMQLTIPGTKSESSEATLPLLPLVDKLLGEAGPPNAPVFTRRAGRPTSRQTVHRHLGEALDALGIDRRRVHDLRHSTGGLLASNGVDTRVVQAVLRHTNAAMSVHYSRPHDPALRDALARVEEALGERPDSA